MFISSSQDAHKQVEISLEATLQWGEKDGNQLAIQEYNNIMSLPLSIIRFFLIG
ncbi:hypothetical protein ACJJIG_01520 [Microbulbifer sp. SSSA007]|uniref:hypothetical protein n=1 Tax=Microbulbifer TaxID=48073 RepID=UPI00035EFDE4|nr:hypothetical protein [Microbulbifer variabilis]